MIEAFAVAAVGDHGVEGVDDRDDAGSEWYLIRFEPARVSAAIVGLVMMKGEQARLF